MQKHGDEPGYVLAYLDYLSHQTGMLGDSPLLCQHGDIIVIQMTIIQEYCMSVYSHRCQWIPHKRFGQGSLSLSVPWETCPVSLRWRNVGEMLLER